MRAGGDGRAVLGDGRGIVDVRGAVVADVADGDAVEVIVQLARIAARLVVSASSRCITWPFTSLIRLTVRGLASVMLTEVR